MTLDVPALPAGTVLTRLFVLTYDGGAGADPHWVDRAPGRRRSSDGTAFGADYVVGACGAAAGRDARTRRRTPARRRPRSELTAPRRASAAAAWRSPAASPRPGRA